MINTAYNYDSPLLRYRWHVKDFQRTNPPRCPGDAAPVRDPGERSGRIETPEAGARVNRAFPASGTVELGPSQVAWVAVRIGSLYWPKEPPITGSGSWTLTVFEGGSPGSFALVLIAVDEPTHEHILRWFEDARRTGSYPGMLLGQGTQLIDEVKVHLGGP